MVISFCDVYVGSSNVITAELFILLQILLFWFTYFTHHVNINLEGYVNLIWATSKLIWFVNGIINWHLFTVIKGYKSIEKLKMCHFSCCKNHWSDLFRFTWLPWEVSFILSCTVEHYKNHSVDWSNQQSNWPSNSFFSKDAGELRFIILRRREGKIPKKKTRETHSAQPDTPPHAT